jgi:hypothetical protein
MKNFEIMPAPNSLRRGSARSFAIADRLLTGDCAQQPSNDDTVIGFEPAFDHAQVALDLAGPDFVLLDDILAIHDKDIASGLIAAQCDIWHQQRVPLLIEGNTDTNVIARQQYAVGGIGQNAAYRQRSRRLVDRRRRIVEVSLVRITDFGL